MENDELYDDILEAKTAFVITLLVAVYCFSVILKSIALHLEWKVICSCTGFLLVTLMGAWLIIRLVRLIRVSKNALNDLK